MTNDNIYDGRQLIIGNFIIIYLNRTMINELKPMSSDIYDHVIEYGITSKRHSIIIEYIYKNGI